MTLNFEQNLGILKKKYFGKILEYPRILEVYEKIVNYYIIEIVELNKDHVKITTTSYK